MNRVRRDDRCLGNRSGRVTAHPSPMSNIYVISLPLIAIVTDGVKFVLSNTPHNGSARYSKFFMKCKFVLKRLSAIKFRRLWQGWFKYLDCSNCYQLRFQSFLRQLIPSLNDFCVCFGKVCLLNINNKSKQSFYLA